MYKILLTLLLCYFLSACATHKYAAPIAKISNSESKIVKKLYTYYNEWRGVKYLEGGMSKQGIDCSAYVHMAYKQTLNKPIARTTELLSSTGQSIQSKQLQAGDLVFFKTGWKLRHVGIYLGNDNFMHASSSRGVTISKLTNPYWNDAYWMARRY